jgi:cytochrome P450
LLSRRGGEPRCNEALAGSLDDGVNSPRAVETEELSVAKQDTVQRPSHVPPKCVVDFDYFRPDGLERDDIYTVLKRLHAKPDILWTPRYGGHWIVTRSEDVRWIRQEAMIFSHEEFVIPRGLYHRLMPPTNVDPPYHARFRAMLNPTFRPAAVQKLRVRSQELAGELIDQLKPRGECEFVSEFARITPVVVFLHLVELPTDRRDEFVGWAMRFINADDQESKDRAGDEVAAFIGRVLDEREARPGDDLFSRIVAWRKHSLYRSEDEVIGTAMTVFLGGLDSVTNLMSFTIRHLADHPEARRRLIENPEIIPRAAEEYIRRHGLAMSARVLKEDVTRKGVTMKKDDMVLVIDALAAIDERAYPDPMVIDFDRNTETHDTFGNGVHKCVGEHLARMELAVFIEEWLRRIPHFRLDPAVPSITTSGVIVGMSQLGLLWDA